MNVIDQFNGVLRGRRQVAEALRDPPSENDDRNPMRSVRRRSGGGWSRLGLPSKLLLLTITFVMLAEVLIFIPSIANFRVNWLTARLTSARLAALAADTAPRGEIPKMVRQELLDTAQVKGVAIKRDRIRMLILPPDGPVVVDASYDLRQMPSLGLWNNLGRQIGLVRDALAVFFAPVGRTIRVYGRAEAGLGKPPARDEFVEIVMPEAPLRDAMIKHGLNILLLSILISVIAAGLVYFALIRVLVKPMMDLSSNMLRFSENPEDPSRIIVTSKRGDEIGVAERELANMQTEMVGLLKQKDRLAQLGLAVSKINHDLRNMLASAQLISDRLAALPDPTVQRFAPKLIASLDRAINFCNDTLKFGRAEEASPRRQVIPLRPLVEQVGDGLDLPRSGVNWENCVDDAINVDADPDHLYRVLNNICRNAAQAIDTQERDAPGTITVRAERSELVTVIQISDDGPGIPPKVRETLFRPFQGTARKGGAGLGLAISAELVRAHGGTLELESQTPGATFRLEIPDRAAGNATDVKDFRQA